MSRATDDKGQMHTIEGLMASMIMLLVLVMIINSTAVTPLSSSTTNKHVQLELMNMGKDTLNSLDYNPNPVFGPNSPLKQSILDWNGDTFVWNGKYFRDTNPLNPIVTDMNNNSSLARAINYTFSQKGIAYDVEVIYLQNTTGNTSIVAKKMIWNGDPSDNSVTVSRMVVLHDDDQTNAATIPVLFYPNQVIPDADNDNMSTFYNIVDVRLTLWRM